MVSTGIQSAWPLFLASQDLELSEKLRQLGEPLRTGGSVPKVLLLCLVIVGIVVAAYYLGKLQEAFRKPVVRDAPMELYCDLLWRLGLSRNQRRLLRHVAKDLDLRHPTAILISEALFDRTVENWRRHRGGLRGASKQAESAADWDSIRARLFQRG